jgi:hypothetical protein
VPEVHKAAHESLPTRDVLDLIDDEDAPFAIELNQVLIEVGSVIRLEAQETIVFEVDVLEAFLAQPVSELGQERGLADPAQPRDDDRMRDGFGFHDFTQPIAHKADISAPKGLALFNQHGFELIRIPFGSPIVFIHSEIILQIVFIVNENNSIPPGSAATP